MCDYIDFAVFIDDIDILIEAVQMVGEAYLDFDNLANAFFAFKQMVKSEISLFRKNYATWPAIQETDRGILGSVRMFAPELGL